MSRSFSGQRITEGIDYVRCSSLSLTHEEIASIPDPPAFSDLDLANENDQDVTQHTYLDDCHNSDDDDDDDMGESKVYRRNFELKKNKRISRTIRLQNRLSSIPTQMYYQEKSALNNQVILNKVMDTKSLSKNTSKYRSSSCSNNVNIMSGIQEVPQFEISFQKSIQALPVLISPMQVATNNNTNSDALSNLYGEDEDSILALKTSETDEVRKFQRSSPTMRSANEVLFDEILSSYMGKSNTQLSVDDNEWRPATIEKENRYEQDDINLPLGIDHKMALRIKSLTMSPPKQLSERNTSLSTIPGFLQPPFPQKHTSSICTFDGFAASESENDLSSLGDKLYLSSPEAKHLGFSDCNDQESLSSSQCSDSSSYYSTNKQNFETGKYIIDSSMAPKLQYLPNSPKQLEKKNHREEITNSFFEKRTLKRAVLSSPVMVCLDFYDEIEREDQHHESDDSDLEFYDAI